MKTKEEIEQLAEEFLTFHQDGSKVYHVKIREAIEFAYNKCQEDMDDEILDELEKFAIEYEKSMVDKRYTEEDMLKAFEKGALYGSTKNGNTHYFDEVINSLNKPIVIPTTDPSDREKMRCI